MTQRAQESSLWKWGVGEKVSVASLPDVCVTHVLPPVLSLKWDSVGAWCDITVGACFSHWAHCHGKDTGEGGFETGQRGTGTRQTHPPPLTLQPRTPRLGRGTPTSAPPLVTGVTSGGRANCQSYCSSELRDAFTSSVQDRVSPDTSWVEQLVAVGAAVVPKGTA